VKYLLLIHLDEPQMKAMPRRDYVALVDEHLVYDDELRANGQMVATEALEDAKDGIVVRVRDGKVSTTDGPFAETKEQLGGFYLVEARDLNEAIQLAARIPAARLGSVEVRPVREFVPGTDYPQ